VIYPFLSVAALHKGLGTVGPVLLPFVVLLLQETKSKTKSLVLNLSQNTVKVWTSKLMKKT
jgi:hypothetical protein